MTYFLKCSQMFIIKKSTKLAKEKPTDNIFNKNKWQGILINYKIHINWAKLGNLDNILAKLWQVLQMWGVSRIKKKGKFCVLRPPENKLSINIHKVRRSPAWNLLQVDLRTTNKTERKLHLLQWSHGLYGVDEYKSHGHYGVAGSQRRVEQYNPQGK